MLPFAASAADRRASGSVRELSSSSTASSIWTSQSPRRPRSPYCRSRGAISSRARARSSRRAPRSGMGSARPPSSAAARLYSRVKLSTSPWRLRAGPQKAASSRSARWDCCSGVRSTSPVPPASMASRNWRYTSRVLPLPAPPRIKVSIFSPLPFLRMTAVTFHTGSLNIHFTMPGGGEQAKTGENGAFLPPFPIRQPRREASRSAAARSSLRIGGKPEKRIEFFPGS